MTSPSFARQWLIFIALWLLVGGGAIGWNLYSDHSAIDSLERERLSNQARVIDKNLQFQLHATDDALNSIRGDLPFMTAQKDGKALLNQRLQAMTDAMVGVRTLLILDSDGRVTASNREQLIGKVFREREYFLVARQSRNTAILHMTSPFKGALGVYVMGVSKVISDERGGFAGVIAAFLDPEYFNTLLDSVLYAPDMWTTLSLENGRLFLMTPTRPGIEGMNLAKPGSLYIRHRDSGQMTTVMTGSDYVTGEECMIAQRTIKSALVPMDKTLVVAVARDFSSIFAVWRRDAYVHGGLFGVLVLASALGLFFYQRRQRAYSRLLADQEAERKRAEEVLRESEKSFKEAQSIAMLGSYVLDISTGAWKSSDVLDQLLGIDEAYEHCVAGWQTLIHPDDRIMRADYFSSEVLDQGKAFDKEYRIIRHNDQAERWVHDLGQLEFDTQGHPLKMHGTIQDITERKQAEEKLHLAASVFTHAREGITITSADGTIIDVNDAFTRTTGYSRAEVLGQNPRILSSGRQDKGFYAAMWRDLIEQGYWHGEIWNRRKSGEVYAEMLTISAVSDAQGNTRQYVALFSDITALKEHQKQLEHIAHYDALTTLPNRVLLADRLHQAMAQAQRRGQRLVVAYLDLDGFKAINDRHGHEAGDQLLIALATRMTQALRKGDTLARLGGDEFVAVLVDVAYAAASVPTLTRLLAAAAEPVHVGDIILQVSASLGVTFYPQAEDVDGDQLLRQADQAMYQAKLAGKNRYHFFNTEQDHSVRSRYESLEHIRLALSKREFVLYYQPKVNMRTGAVIGAEALIRWQHPEKGLLPPAAFLPVIEDHPLAVELGEWVIDSALTQMELWRAAGLDIPVSVNVGAYQLQQANFVERLREILGAHPDTRPGDLEMEILETSALDDLALVSQVIEACREIGVMFALDDFGTGYSSLTYLKRLQVGQLKIDQSFVRDMLGDPDDLAILDGVIGLSTAFRRQVIAEGVETVEHGAMLLQLGCELAQGYGIARPMPAQEMPGWSAAWRPGPAWGDLPSVGRDDLPLLFASVEHRAWIAAIENRLRGENETPPQLDYHQCRFGKWLDTEGMARYSSQPALQAIDQLHQQVHTLAIDLLELQAQERNPEALGRLGELHGLRDTLLEQLKMLVQGNRP